MSFRLAKDERGASLVLIALAIVPLILLVALSVDTIQLGLSSNEQKRLSGFMAMAAVEAIQTSRQEHEEFDYAQLTRAAIERSAEVAELQANQIFTKNRELELDETDSVASLRFGRWWAEEPVLVSEDGNSVPGCQLWNEVVAPPSSGRNFDARCPCPSGNWQGPCFEENLRPELAEAVAATNAVEVTLRTKQESPVHSIVSSLLSLIGGQQSIRIAATSIATLIPRNGVFLIDLSRSTYFDTHLPFDRQGDPNSSEYVFRLGTSPIHAGQTTASCSEGVHDNPCYDPANWLSPNCAMWSAFYDRIYNGTPEGDTPLIANTRPGPGSHQQHYKSDYQCVRPDGWTSSYLVDTYVNADAGGYTGPEPLNTILGGIHEALRVVEARSVAGDSIGIIAFDQDVNVGGRRIPPTRPGQQEFEDLLNLTDTRHPAESGVGIAGFRQNQQLRLKKFFFPREGANTDLSGAVWEARNMLTELSSFHTSSNFVAMFTDGLASCMHLGGSHFLKGPKNNRTLDTDQCLNPTSTNVLWDSGHWCGDWWTGWRLHDWGLLETVQLLSGSGFSGGGGNERHALRPAWPGDENYNDEYVATYKELGIQFHLFLIGDETVPSTLLAQRPGDEHCMWEDDWAAYTNMDHYGTSSNRAQMFAKLYGRDPWFTVDEPSRASLCDMLSQCHDRDQYYGEGCQYRIRGRASDFQYSYTFPGDFLFIHGVHPTGGRYTPVRRPCYPEGSELRGGLSCSDGGFKKFLDEQCYNGSLYTYYKPRDKRIASPEELRDPAFKNRHVMLGRHGNGDPRHLLVCDPLCRSQGEQVRDAIQSLYEDNPYVIVK